ncbi:hypothetical protein WJX72_011794 [[Myrmecia] bisecta]|uniref:Ubiquitin-like domain-containing protein n=1 Tax=[Myrmecia] bisecta TaxID=41462 RepID=A0AAW1PGQ5_9CHLO
MAAFGECGSGNQIFVTMRKGSEYPPRTVDVRIKYEQTIRDLKEAVATKTQVPVDKQLLFWHKKELTVAYDSKTLQDMNLHTGFSLMGYDLTVEPDYWPPVVQTPDGLLISTQPPS